MYVRRLFPQCSIEEGNDLGAGAGVTGAERGGGSAAGHALGHRPTRRLGVIAVGGNVRKVHGVVHHRLARRAPQERDHLRAAANAARIERGGGRN